MGEGDWNCSNYRSRKKKIKPVPVPTKEEIAENEKLMDLLA